MPGRKILSSSEPRSAPADPSTSIPPRLFAGTSGWAYPTWKPDFYPQKQPTKKLLSYYASRLNTCEVNYSFRKLPTSTQLDDWLAQVEDRPGFRFSFKAPQRITHFSRLRDCETHVAEFLDVLKPVAKAGKLGLLLFQLPPNFKANVPLLLDFLALKRLRAKACPPLAFEFRHESWFAPETEAALRKHGAAFCIAETDDLTTPEIHTAAAYTCFRLRRSGGYSSAELEAFAQRFTALAADRDVYVHFRHEDEPTGALNAAEFLEHAARIAAAGRDSA